VRRKPRNMRFRACVQLTCVVRVVLVMRSQKVRFSYRVCNRGTVKFISRIRQFRVPFLPVLQYSSTSAPGIFPRFRNSEPVAISVTNLVSDNHTVAPVAAKSQSNINCSRRRQTSCYSCVWRSTAYLNIPIALRKAFRNHGGRKQR
jgi:hypothetical protein